MDGLLRQRAFERAAEAGANAAAITVWPRDHATTGASGLHGGDGGSAKNGWQAIVAVVDSSGHIVSLDRMDGAQFGSIDIARQKAWSAVAFERPTKAFQDTLESGGTGLRVLTLDGVTPVDGGLPFVVNGHIVGGIGISGVLPAHDADRQVRRRRARRHQPKVQSMTSHAPRRIVRR